MISTGFVNSIKRGCRQLCGRRIYFFAMTVIPIVLAGFLLGLMRNGLPLHIPTAIVNHDNTESTRKLIRNIKSSEEVSVVSVVSSEAEAMQLIRKGKIYGFYVIPFNFTSTPLPDALRNWRTTPTRRSSFQARCSSAA